MVAKGGAFEGGGGRVIICTPDFLSNLPLGGKIKGKHLDTH